MIVHYCYSGCLEFSDITLFMFKHLVLMQLNMVNRWVLTLSVVTLISYFLITSHCWLIAGCCYLPCIVQRMGDCSLSASNYMYLSYVYSFPVARACCFLDCRLERVCALSGFAFKFVSFCSVIIFPCLFGFSVSVCGLCIPLFGFSGGLGLFLLGLWGLPCALSHFFLGLHS